MDNEVNFTGFKLGLKAGMERINSSYNEIYGGRQNGVLPTATTFIDVYLRDDLPWETETDGHGNILLYVRAATAPSRDFFLSTAAS